MKNIFSNLQKWNWSLFMLIMTIALIGGLSNKSFSDIKGAVLFSLIIGVLFGLLAAVITKDK